MHIVAKLTPKVMRRHERWNALQTWSGSRTPVPEVCDQLRYQLRPRSRRRNEVDRSLHLRLIFSKKLFIFTHLICVHSCSYMVAKAGSAVGHRPLGQEFDSRTKSEERFVFHVAFEVSLAHLAYHVHKSGCKTTRFNIPYWSKYPRFVWYCLSKIGLFVDVIMLK